MRYRQANTLQAYLLVQPDAPSVEGFARNQAGQWVLTDYGFEDEIELPALGCRIAVKDLYERVTFESPSRPEAGTIALGFARHHTTHCGVDWSL